MNNSEIKLLFSNSRKDFLREYVFLPFETEGLSATKLIGLISIIILQSLFIKIMLIKFPMQYNLVHIKFCLYFKRISILWLLHCFLHMVNWKKMCSSCLSLPYSFWCMFLPTCCVTYWGSGIKISHMIMNLFISSFYSINFYFLCLGDIKCIQM